jgi:hypothetical protein
MQSHASTAKYPDEVRERAVKMVFEVRGAGREGSPAADTRPPGRRGFADMLRPRTREAPAGLVTSDPSLLAAQGRLVPS